MKRFIQMLRDNNSLPDFFIVENYANEDEATYPNEVGNEWTRYHQLGTARLMQTEWFPEAVDDGSTWAGFDVVQDRHVDTAQWMGILDVSLAPFIYSLDLDSWMYVEENWVEANGSWTYIYR